MVLRVLKVFIILIFVGVYRALCCLVSIGFYRCYRFFGL